MALQPAAGARDLHPWEVDSNRRLGDLLASTYRLWGYEEVSPPSIERLDTLRAGGGIPEPELIRLAAEEPLGLRPELTASIARAAGTRMVDRPRPLRLWSSGSIFRRSIDAGGTQRINERLHSGVELLGVSSAAADCELMHLLLAAVATLELRPSHQPTLLVGHHGLLDGLVLQLPQSNRGRVREALTGFDPLALDLIDLPQETLGRLKALMGLRGRPAVVLEHLKGWLGPVPVLSSLESILLSIAPAAERAGVRVQLDPTFQPHFDLYDGLVLKLVCQGDHAPTAIASGGRYDALVGRFCSDPVRSAGTGFGFDIDALRDLLGPAAPGQERPVPWLVAGSRSDQMDRILARMAELHAGGSAAELCDRPCPSREEAERIARERGCRGAIWLEG